jgi:molybdate transport system regulatory protein
MGAKTAHNLGKALGHSKTDKRIDILRRLQDAGSISEAARRAGVSYKAAWQAIDILSNLAGTPLVEKVVGGSGGGGAQLTQAGKDLLKASVHLELAKSQVVKHATAPATAASQATGMLGFRTTMRNQFPCTVAAVVKKGGFVRVSLSTKGGTVFHSLITSASAELLELAVGQAAWLLCKATAVLITLDSKDKQKNRVQGLVERKSRGGSHCEVNLLVEPGITLVGFADPLVKLRVGDQAVAEIEASALVLAMAH